MSARLVFMGTPDFAAPALQVLLESPHEVVAVYTRAPRPKGRGHMVQKSPVHELAEAHGVPVFTPATLKTPEAQAEFSALKADLAVVAAYGLLLPKAVLDAPRLGCVNLHASLLPRWRGAAPIQRAILAGDAESGVCLMKMEEGLDTGPVYARVSVPITPETTASQLHDALSAAGAKLLAENLDGLLSGTLPPVPQPEEGVVYAAKLDKTEALMNWAKSAEELSRQVRAFSPWPGAEFVLNGERVKVLAAEVAAASGKPGLLLDGAFTVACGEGSLKLLKVKRPGRAPVDGASCLRGLHLVPGTQL